MGCTVGDNGGERRSPVLRLRLDAGGDAKANETWKTVKLLLGGHY